MRKYSDATLLCMTKAELIEQLRCAEHNQTVAEEALAQQAENVKAWEPVVHCRDCKHLWRDLAGPFCGCGRGLKEIYNDTFCSYGERESNAHAQD